MRLSVRWLNQFLHTDLPVETLVENLTMAGLEVEEELDLGMKSGRIVVAKVLEVVPHPNADKLHLCRVDAGGSEPLGIVCGAPNVTAGMVAPCALEGARLPDGTLIKRSKIRGQASQGMLCSAHELDFGADHSGILALPDTYKVGEPFDYLIEIKVTPNRPDCLSILGVARDLGAMIGKKVFPPTPRFKEMLDHIDAYVRLSIAARNECSRYTCRLIRGVKIAASPLWLQRALEACGMRPINNVVDVTNYVLLELGHPLHAFDFDTLTEGAIKVRMAQAGEELTIIDGAVLSLTEQDLVIADSRRAVALAGVMGGQATEVSAETTNILLESAYFDPSTIRKTARRYGLQTDASYRFERGTDRLRLTVSLNRAVQLIQELAGGEVAKGMLDVQTAVVEAAPIVLDIARVNRLLGVTLTSTEIADYLVNLGFEIRRSEKQALVVAVPSHRVDVTRDVDLIEEVARLLNYNKIPSTMPRIIPTGQPRSVLDKLAGLTRRILADTGFYEAVGYSFISEVQAAVVGFDPARQPHVANPLTTAQVLMRPSLLPGLLEAVGRNQKQDEPDIRLFETGKVWLPGAVAGDPAGERGELALAMAGSTPPHWSAPERPVDYYDIKGVVEALVTRWGGQPAFVPLAGSTEPSPGSTEPPDAAGPPAYPEVFHPGRSAHVLWEGETIGEVGELHPDLLAACDLKGRICAARLDLERVAELTSAQAPRFRPIPRLPGSRRDLALVVDRQTPAAALVDEIRKTGGR
ncbi:MAG: phenylalanine--tRNA ligase subunit beta, partial [bacterium]|nr:phenylalanine--tRNA ligase subunit beta [bacterium]